MCTLLSTTPAQQGLSETACSGTVPSITLSGSLSELQLAASAALQAMAAYQATAYDLSSRTDKGKAG